jgi:hypothetical protein
MSVSPGRDPVTEEDMWDPRLTDWHGICHDPTMSRFREGARQATLFFCGYFSDLRIGAKPIGSHVW